MIQVGVDQTVGVARAREGIEFRQDAIESVVHCRLTDRNVEVEILRDAFVAPGAAWKRRRRPGRII